MCRSIRISCDNQHVLIHTWVAIFLSWLWDKRWGSLCQNQLGRTRRCSGSVPAAGFCSVRSLSPNRSGWLIVILGRWNNSRTVVNPVEQTPPHYPHPSENKLVQAACHVSSGFAAHLLSRETAATNQCWSGVISACWRTDNVNLTRETETLFMSTFGPHLLDELFSCMLSIIIYFNGNQQERKQTTFFPL